MGQGGMGVARGMVQFSSSCLLDTSSGFVIEFYFYYVQGYQALPVQSIWVWVQVPETHLKPLLLSVIMVLPHEG